MGSWTRIKDKDLLNIVAVLKEVQAIRNNIDKDPAVRLEGYNSPSGTRKDTYSEVVKNILKERTNPLVAKMEGLMRRLN